MTCIVGVIEKEKVYIGGDSAGVGGLDVIIRKDVKVFKVGEFVIGCTTSFRMLQLIRFSLKPPKIYPDVDLYEYMCTEFVNTLRKCFREGGFIETKDTVERGGSFLIGYKNRLFNIEEDFQVGESVDEFNAVGCGARYALGALKAMDNNLPIEEKILKSLDVAVYFSAGVRPPFIIEHT